MAPRKGAAQQEGKVSSGTFHDLDAPSAAEETIKFDGAIYTLARQEDLSIADQENLHRFFLRFNDIKGWGDDDDFLTDEQEAAMDALQVRMARIALPDAPVEVLAKPENRKKRAQLIDLFTKAVDPTPFVMRWIRTAQAKQASSLPNTAPGSDSDSTATATHEPSPISSSRAGAA